MILSLYLNQFYKTEQGVGSSPKRNSCCIVSCRLSILLLWSHTTDRTRPRDELYANGKLKGGVPGEPREDDLMLSTRVESISSIKFFNHLQLGDAVFHSRAYRRITRRNHHTDAYVQEILANRCFFFFMVVKDVFVQMPKGEKHFANTVPCNNGLFSQ